MSQPLGPAPRTLLYLPNGSNLPLPKTAKDQATGLLIGQILLIFTQA
jgi:hypothetical protein